jgi:hypothetical protein
MPTLHALRYIIRIARLGGYLARARYSATGNIVMWRDSRASPILLSAANSRPGNVGIGKPGRALTKHALTRTIFRSAA